MNDGTTLECTFCEHTVNTLQFDSASEASRRTQAAAAMNQHAAKWHSSRLRNSLPTKSGSRGAL
jgi:hypothetical protein